MSLVQPKLPYRIGVTFEPPLSSLAQLRDVCAKLNTKTTLPVELSVYGAKVIAIFPKGMDLSGIDYGRVWFVVGSGKRLSTATIKTIRPEVNITR